MCLGKNNYVYEGQKQKWTVCEPFTIQSLAEPHTLRLYGTKNKQKKIYKNMFVWKPVTILNVNMYKIYIYI